jgi:hypothetical protein
MNNRRQVTWLTVLAISNLIIGSVMILYFRNSLYPLNILSLWYYQGALFIMAGIILLIWKSKSATIYSIIGTVYIINSIFVFLNLLFFGTVMNDSNVPANQVASKLFGFAMTMIPFIIYWALSTTYVIRAKRCRL